MMADFQQWLCFHQVDLYDQIKTYPFFYHQIFLEILILRNDEKKVTNNILHADQNYAKKL